MTGKPLELFRKFFGAVRAIFWLWGSFLAPDLKVKKGAFDTMNKGSGALGKVK